MSASALACLRYSAGSACTAGSASRRHQLARSAFDRCQFVEHRRRSTAGLIAAESVPPGVVVIRRRPAAGTRSRRRPHTAVSMRAYSAFRAPTASVAYGREAGMPAERARPRRRRIVAGGSTSRASSLAPAISRSRANSRTVTRTRAAAPPRAPPRRPGRPPRLRSRLAALEVLVLPDRRDLLDALDRVAACGERLGPVRRRRGDRDAGLADVQPCRRGGGAPSIASGQRSPISSAMRSKARSASGSYASYSSRTRRP